jgi:hypothetical protein
MTVPGGSDTQAGASAGAGPQIPYPGLRAFTRDEAHLFFGRNHCIADMIDKLAQSRFLSVLGSSGSGKSSLVRTGMLESLPTLHPARGDWTIVDFHPAGAPMDQLAAGLLCAHGTPPDTDETAALSHLLRMGPRAVIEWCEAGNLPPGHNLLLLVDQFEELFRFSSYAGREEAEAFARLLIESSHSDLPISVCLTMRTEFLSDCAMIPGLAERINDGLFLTPRINRDEAEEAIVGPAGISQIFEMGDAPPFEVEPVLVNQLLNDMATLAPWEDKDDASQTLARRADQLPLMQHVLNQLWLETVADAPADAQGIVLTREHYRRIGGLTGALDVHGRAVLARLGALDGAEGDGPAGEPVALETVGRIFRSLVAGPSISKAVRRPCRFDELARVAGSETAARRVVDAFRAHGVNFLRPYEGEELQADTVIDISHESLIRQWGMLSAWFEEEREAALAWQQLTLQQEAWASGRADLLSGLALANIGEFWSREQPSAEWAARHGGDFAANERFYRESEAQAARERLEEERERTRETRGLRIRSAVFGVLALIALIGAGYGFMSARAANQAREDAEAAALAQVQAANDARDAAQRAQAAERMADEQRSAAENSAARATAAASAQERAAALAAQSERRAIESLSDAEQAQARAEAEAARSASLIDEISRAIADSQNADDLTGEAMRRGVDEALREGASAAPGDPSAFLSAPALHADTGWFGPPRPAPGGGTAMRRSAAFAAPPVILAAGGGAIACEEERSLMREDGFADWRTRSLPSSLLSQCLARILAQAHEARANSTVRPFAPGSTQDLAQQLTIYTRLGEAFDKLNVTKALEGNRSAFQTGMKLYEQAGWQWFADPAHVDYRDAFFDAAYSWAWDARESGFPQEAAGAFKAFEEIAGQYAPEDICAVRDGAGRCTVGDAPLAVRLSKHYNLGIRIYRHVEPDMAALDKAEDRALSFARLATEIEPDNLEYISRYGVVLSNLSRITNRAAWIPEYCALAQETADRFVGRTDIRIANMLLRCADYSLELDGSADADGWTHRPELAQAALDYAEAALIVDPYARDLYAERVDLLLELARKEKDAHDDAVRQRLAALREEKRAIERQAGEVAGIALTGRQQALQDVESRIGQAQEQLLWRNCPSICLDHLRAARRDFARILHLSEDEILQFWPGGLMVDAGWEEDDAAARSFLDTTLERARYSLTRLPRMESLVDWLHSIVTPEDGGDAGSQSTASRLIDRDRALEIADWSLAAIGRYPRTSEFADRDYMNEACRMHGTRIDLLKGASLDRVLAAAREMERLCDPFARDARYAVYTRNALRSNYHQLAHTGLDLSDPQVFAALEPYLERASLMGDRASTDHLLDHEWIDAPDRAEELRLRAARQDTQLVFQYLDADGDEQNWYFRHSDDPLWSARTFFDAMARYDRALGPSSGNQFLKDVEARADALNTPMPPLARSVLDEAEIHLATESALDEKYSLANALLALQSATGPAPVPAGADGTAFDGYSPASIRKGEPQREGGVVHGFRAGAPYRLLLDESARLYDWPAFSGWDPVALADGRLVAGDPFVTASIGDSVVTSNYAMFADEASRARWAQDRANIMLAAADRWNALQPELLAWVADRERIWARAMNLLNDADRAMSAADDAIFDSAPYSAKGEEDVTRTGLAATLHRAASSMFADPRRTPVNGQGIAFGGLPVDRLDRSLDDMAAEFNDQPVTQTFFRGAFVMTEGFGSNPQVRAMWPQFNGWDPVELAQGRFVAGDPATIATALDDGRAVNLFATPANAARWQRFDPADYMAARNHWLSTLPEYAGDLPEIDPYLVNIAQILDQYGDRLPDPALRNLRSMDMALRAKGRSREDIAATQEDMDEIVRILRESRGRVPTGDEGLAFDGYAPASLITDEPRRVTGMAPGIYKGTPIAEELHVTPDMLKEIWPLFNGWDPVELARGRFVAGSVSHREVIEPIGDPIPILFANAANRETWSRKAARIVTPAAQTYVARHPDYASDMLDRFTIHWLEAVRSGFADNVPGISAQNAQAQGLVAVQRVIDDPSIRAAAERLAEGELTALDEMIAISLPEFEFSGRRTPIGPDRFAFGGATPASIDDYEPVVPETPSTAYFRGALVNAEGLSDIYSLEREWPGFNGWDPYELSQGHFVAGATQFFAFDDIQQRMLLFASADARDAYEADPQGVLAAAAVTWLRERPDYADDISTLTGALEAMDGPGPDDPR